MWSQAPQLAKQIQDGDLPPEAREPPKQAPAFGGSGPRPPGAHPHARGYEDTQSRGGASPV